MRFNQKSSGYSSNTDVSKKAKEDIEYLFACIDSINVEEVKNEEVHLRLGNQVFKLVNIGNIDETYIENKIREEFREKLSKKLEVIKRKIDTKLNQMSEFVATIREDYEAKEKDLKQQLRNAISMPDVTIEHGKKGLSVIRGGSRDSLIWLVQGVYWPKYVNHQAIEPEYSTKLITPIIIMIKTNGSKITEVSVRKPIGLERFKHYHSFQGGECWGKWKYSGRTWNSPNDIIAIAQEAQIVLENINANSPGNDSPQGLPRLATLKRHLVEKGKEGQRTNINLREQRMGIEEQETHFDNANIWRT